MMRRPHVTYTDTESSDDSAGYYVGVALDDLVEYATEHGATLEELHERIDEAYERCADDREPADGEPRG